MTARTTPAPADRPATISDWLEGARPHTWANAFAPVIAGVGAAAHHSDILWGRAALALIVAWALIVGVNYANDYSDGIRGTDDDRSGPQRLTGSGLVPPKTVKTAAFAAFGVAGIAGLALALLSAWWLVLVGVACIAGAWFYTGGDNPYGYRGLGEVAVFVFFGLVAVLGTEFTQSGRISWPGVTAAIAVGAISASVNLANNLRDIPSDTEAGKVTLAVRLGDANTRKAWVVLAGMPLIASVVLAFATPWALAGLVAAPLIYVASRPVTGNAKGPDLIPVLGMAGRAMLLWAVVTALALALG
ncbi:1,4-dihydroxy-2-naphthoate polyprenyltransferase [Corynebacterium freneyi]|uniref:1,4-dihydroxy-2-naphthoate octaprenyltransferase n=1 Tax=Corynebacterium freneyi DNF00450 TaxID=1287475 RepID=A0A095Y886_9CORY|nr:1,4-dihydroxy-2-naphthoate polyprenyltransferase [Corynebacterium freneyi]KGF18473.1 1,4-dihydroxy-2-naphthoate prenyltransferase [Corynebacterium freneyi DNF00450]